MTGASISEPGVVAPVSIAQGGTGAATALAAIAALQGLGLQAGSTAPAGFALQNATPTIVSFVVPNDGKTHWCLAMAGEHCTVATTGGAVSLNYVLPDGFAVGHTLLAPTVAAGDNSGMQNTLLIPVQAGSTVSISQSTAMTAGAALVWAALFVL